MITYVCACTVPKGPCQMSAVNYDYKVIWWRWIKAISIIMERRKGRPPVTLTWLCSTQRISRHWFIPSVNDFLFPQKALLLVSSVASAHACGAAGRIRDVTDVGWCQAKPAHWTAPRPLPWQPTGTHKEWHATCERQARDSLEEHHSSTVKLTICRPLYVSCQQAFTNAGWLFGIKWLQRCRKSPSAIFYPFHSSLLSQRGHHPKINIVNQKYVLAIHHDSAGGIYLRQWKPRLRQRLGRVLGLVGRQQAQQLHHQRRL